MAALRSKQGIQVPVVPPEMRLGLRWGIRQETRSFEWQSFQNRFEIKNILIIASVHAVCLSEDVDEGRLLTSPECGLEEMWILRESLFHK